MRYIVVFLCGLIGLATTAAAQSQDGVFSNYDAYAEFVDQNLMQRKFTTLILGLGGRDEFTDEQLAVTQQQMDNVWRNDFEEVSLFREEDLGNGVSQEGRIYWTGKSYAYYYAILHQRANELVVINFVLNSQIKPVMARF